MKHNESVASTASPSKSRIMMELQESTERQTNLRKINSELTKIIQNTYEENSHLALINQLNSVQAEHNKQIQSLKLKQHMIVADHNFEIQQCKNKLEEAIYRAESSENQILKLKQFIQFSKRQKEELENKVRKYEKMINNQEVLIDEYRESIDDQICLQKQVIKAIYAQKQLQNKKRFEKALKCMEENYQKRLKESKIKEVQKQYRNELKVLKKFCEKKINQENCIGFRKMMCPSSYSTLEK